MKSLRLTRALAAALFTLGFSFVTHAAESKTTHTAGSAPHATSSKAAKIDLNTADTAALETLPGVGPATAKSIVAARPFASIDDVMRVKGIKEGTFEVIKDRITVR